MALVVLDACDALPVDGTIHLNAVAVRISDFLIPVGWTDGFPERVWRIFRVTNGLRRLSFLGSDFRMIGHAPD
ncbi:MAG: hypothetical protein ABIF71_04195, partial [Planctomycetota bacterium]